MQLVVAYFNLEEKGNYQEGSNNLGKGVNILHIKEELSSIARNLNIDLKMAENLLQSAWDKLYTAREKRVHPYKDDKILMDWNGLLIMALAKGGRILKEKRFTEAAEKTVEFFLTNMRTPQGFFFRRYREGEAAIPAFLEDYTFFIWGLIELYESTFKPEYLATALELNQLLLLHFSDKENGGFFQTSDQSEEVLVRNKEVFDGAIPSGNSIAMLNLIRLARLTGNPNLEQEARRIAQAFAENILVSPAYYTQFLSALDFAFGPSFELVIVGQQGRKETEKMIEAIEKTFAPNKVVLFRPTDEENPKIVSINSFLKELTEIEGKTTAYVCRNYHCNLPTTDPYKMLELLRG